MSAPNQPPAGAAAAERIAHAPAEGDPASAPPFAWPEGADPVLAAFDGSDDARLDPETVERILDALLRAYPEAPVTPIGEGGVVVPLPDSIPLRDNPVLEARSGMDMVAYDAAVLAAWDRARAVGIARCTYRPLGDPEVTRSLFLIDMREAHGVVLTLSAHKGTGLTGTPPPRPETPELRARFATIRKEASAGILSVDGAFTEILGWTAEDMQSRRSVEFIHPDDQALAIDNWMNMLSAPGPGRRVRLRHRHRDGSWVWLEFTNHNLLADPAHQCVVGEIVDISEEMAAQEELRAREQLLDRLAGAIPVGLLQLDARGSRRLHQRADPAHPRCAPGGDRRRAVRLVWMPIGHARRRAGLRCSAMAVRPTSRSASTAPPAGGVRFCTVNLRPLTLEDGTVSGAIACVADVTDSSRMREELKQRATFDELTGCYNRASIMLALEAKHRERREVQPTAASCSWTSTSSSRSTIATATPSATSCCAPSRRHCAAWSATATWSGASAATSFSWCARTSATTPGRSSWLSAWPPRPARLRSTWRRASRPRSASVCRGRGVTATGRMRWWRGRTARCTSPSGRGAGARNWLLRLRAGLSV